jgi:hypothetical protein
MAAERIEGVAHALRQAGQDLAGRDEGTLAHYTDSLAGQLDNFSNTLRDRDIGSLLEDAKQLAHRQPELFVAGALAAGFVLGRFFKSSRRSHQDRTQYDYQYGYNEYDPRDASRRYGEPYGQRYGEQFSGDRGRQYSRDYDAGYRAGFQSEYGSQAGQGSNEQWRDQWVRSSPEQMGQSSQGQFGQSGSAQGYSGQGYSGQSYGQGSSQQFGQPASQSSGQVTTHGLGTGQSIGREAELRRGQEFGQGEEQVSNYKGTESKRGSATTQDPDKEEGEIR